MNFDQDERLARTRAFFGVRAAGWDQKFGADGPLFAAAVAEAGLPRGARTADVGCGTGRALPALREGIGPDGPLLGVDVTPEMIDVARPRAARTGAVLLRADAMHLPLRDGCLDVVFAAGLISHLEPVPALRELARVSATGARLVLFHPIGRAALAARHGHEPRADDPLNEPALRPLLAATGWTLDGYDDAPHRFLAMAYRA